MGSQRRNPWHARAFDTSEPRQARAFEERRRERVSKGTAFGHTFRPGETRTHALNAAYEGRQT